MKTQPVGAELFHADRQTERLANMTELIVIFRNFANAPKNRNFMTSFKHYWLKM